MITTDTLLVAVKAAVYSTSQISDEIIISMIQDQIDAIGSDDKYRCLVLFNSVIAVLQFLANKWNIDAAERTGGATSRMEKVGQVQVQEDWENGTASSNPWTPILNDYLNGVIALPTCGTISQISGKIKVGGVDRAENERAARSGVNGLHGVATIDTPHKRFYKGLFK